MINLFLASSLDKQGITETEISPSIFIPEFSSTPSFEILSNPGAL